MTKKLRVALPCLIGVCLVWIAWRVIFPDKPEPLYAGKLESYWVDLLANENKFVFATQKAGIWGTNCEPILLKGLDRGSNPISKLCRQLWPKLPGWVKARWPQPIDAATVQRNAAKLLSMNPDYKILLPVLKSHPDPEVRLWMIGGLQSYRDDDVTLALIKALDDKDPLVRQSAIVACSSIYRNRDLMFLARKKALTNNDPLTPRYGIWIPEEMLDDYLTYNRDTMQGLIPDLVTALHDSDSEVREMATNILRRVAPSELANPERRR
jgi:hypothetical protein